MAKPLPGLDVPVVDSQTGRMTQIWYEYFSTHQKLGQLPDVSPTAPTAGQVLTFNGTTKLWTPT